MAEEQNRNGLGRVLLDPVRLQQQTKYKTNGLTVTSNNVNIMPRDAAGNIMLHEKSSKNPLLIIEPVDTKIMLQSVLKVLDTRFEYFKFPVTIVATDIEDLSIDLTIPDLDIDTIYARYRPSESRRILLPSGDWWEGEKFSGILMDFVEDGVTQKETNQYQITKEIKESGIDLRFRIQIRHRFDTPTTAPTFNTISQNIIGGSPISQNITGGSPLSQNITGGSTLIQPVAETGTCYFSIIRNTPNVPPGGWPPPLNKLFKGPFANTSILTPDAFGSIGQYEEQTLELDLVILNSEFEIGDYFSIGAFAGQNSDTSFHTILPNQTYWVITDASKNVDDWNQEL